MMMLPIHLRLQALGMLGGLVATEWGQRIEGAAHRGRFTSDDVERAMAWPDCACGQQDPSIPRYAATGKPMDRRLAALGVLFAQCVESDDVAGAVATLVAIERRASEILSTLPKEP